MANRLRGQSAWKSSFVPLTRTGLKPAVFAAGSWREYRDLSCALGSDQPFYQMDAYALQEERLLAGATLLRTVQDIATHFVRDILSMQPFGPFFLAGQCEGSIIALEIARQLQRQDRQIGALMQLDTPPTGYFQTVPWRQRISSALARRKNPITIIKNRMNRILATPSTENYIWNAIWCAIRAYDSDEMVDGEIIIFRAEQRRWLLAPPLEDVAVGWERLGAVKVYDVPGDHEQLLVNPTAQSIIRHVLEDVQQRVSAKT